jgi:transcriptional regulator with XRE-family HTH domain/predicted NAD-dependent protein-ADP-ribosyltransferase YbiA (DUF1768 family)
MKTQLRIEEILRRRDMNLTSITGVGGVVNNVSNLSTSLNSNPRLDLLRRISNLLKIEIADLVTTTQKTYGYISVMIFENEIIKTFDDINELKGAIKDINKFINNTLNNEFDSDNVVKYKDGLNDTIDIIENIKKLLGVDGLQESEINKLLQDVCDTINSKRPLKKKRNNTESKQLLNIYNLKKSLTYKSDNRFINPTLNLLNEVADALGVDMKYLLSLNHHVKIQGIVNYLGEIITIESLNDLSYLGDKVRNIRLSNLDDQSLKDYIERVNLNYQEKQIPSPNYNNEQQMFRNEDYDMSSPMNLNSEENLVFSFRKRDDIRTYTDPNNNTRKDYLLNFSNMLKYKMTLLDVSFEDSECAYISGYYTNEGELHENIQSELSKYSKGGYNAKGVFRKQINRYTNSIRQNFTGVNFEWMKLVIWAKVKTNEEFRNMLLEIPKNAYIIEDTSYHHGDTAEVWGCKNPVLKLARIIKRNQLRHLLRSKGVSNKSIAKGEKMIDNSINNIGHWIGKNATGKALMICKKALHNNTFPNIDLDILNNANIHWRGRRILIEKDETTLNYKYRNI